MVKNSIKWKIIKYLYTTFDYIYVPHHARSQASKTKSTSTGKAAHWAYKTLYEYKFININKVQDKICDINYNLNTSVYKDELNSLIMNCLKQLSIRERQVLIYRNYSKLTYDRIGAHYGVGRERIRQIEHRALAKFRKYFRVSKVDRYYVLELLDTICWNELPILMKGE